MHVSIIRQLLGDEVPQTPILGLCPWTPLHMDFFPSDPILFLAPNFSMLPNALDWNLKTSCCATINITWCEKSSMSKLKQTQEVEQNKIV